MVRPVKALGDEERRYCTSCYTLKPLDNFPKNKLSYQGRRSECKPCHAFRGSQAQLYSALHNGDKSVVECPICEKYYRKSSTRKNCRDCEKK